MTDSHAHLLDAAFDGDRDEVMARARQAGVLAHIEAAVDMDTSRRAQAWCASASDRWAAVGVHPHAAGEVAESDWAELERLASRPDVVAVGEIGLDYHGDGASRAVQQEVFRRQLLMARRLGKPVILHVREADDDVFAAVHAVGGLSGVFHCFTGDVARARRALDTGFYVSFSGILTFPKAEELREAASFCPLDRVLVETDAPYLAPVPLRGRRNEPAHVQLTLARLASLRGLAAPELALRLEENLHRLFDFPMAVF